MNRKVLTDRVRAAQAGSLRDFSALVYQFQDMAVGYGQVLLKDFHLAQDAAQDAFVQAFTHLEQIEKPEAFPGWFRQIVFSCCMRYHKRRKATFVPLSDLGEMADGGLLPDAQLEHKERSLLLNDALSSLSEKEKTALILYYIREHTQKEMADFLGVSSTTVKKRLQTARQKMHRRLLTMVRENVEKVAPSQDKRFARKVLARVEAAAHESTVVGAMHGMLNAAGGNWSVARVSGTFGHAFSFCMKKGAGEVWQSAVLDWDLFFGLWKRIGFEQLCFQAVLKGQRIKAPTKVELKKIKEDTWQAVCESIDLGVPVMAWTPMTVEQKRQKLHASEWGLLVGYDESNRTYTVRHQRNGNKEFQVPFDEFGYNDPVNWYCVLVLGTPIPTDRKAVVIASLRDALWFANGTRCNREHMAYAIDALGFEAYEMWRDALADGSANVQRARGHANALRGMRKNAAAYVRECVDLFDADVAQVLTQAAACYDMEVAALDMLYRYSQEAFDGDGFSEFQRQECVAALSAALEADRLAIGHIERALDLVGGYDVPKALRPDNPGMGDVG